MDAVGLDWTRPGGHRIARLVRQALADVPAGQLRFAAAWAAAAKRGDQAMIDALLELDGMDDLEAVATEAARAGRDDMRAMLQAVAPDDTIDARIIQIEGEHYLSVESVRRGCRMEYRLADYPMLSWALAGAAEWLLDD